MANNDGRYTTKKLTTYMNVRLSRDAKHFEASGDKPAATYISFYDGTKGGTDIPIDARIIRGANLFKGLKKGDVVTLAGPVQYKADAEGKIRGTIYDVVDVATLVNLKEREEGATPAPVAEDTDAPTFA